MSKGNAWRITPQEWENFLKHRRRGKHCDNCLARWPCLEARVLRLFARDMVAVLERDERISGLLATNAELGVALVEVTAAVHTFLAYANSDTTTKSDSGWIHALDDLGAAVNLGEMDANSGQRVEGDEA